MKNECDCVLDIDNYLENKLCKDCNNYIEILLKAYCFYINDKKIVLEKISANLYNCYDLQTFIGVGVGKTIKECLVDYKKTLDKQGLN